MESLALQSIRANLLFYRILLLNLYHTFVSTDLSIAGRSQRPSSLDGGDSVEVFAGDYKVLKTTGREKVVGTVSETADQG